MGSQCCTWSDLEDVNVGNPPSELSQIGLLGFWPASLLSFPTLGPACWRDPCWLAPAPLPPGGAVDGRPAPPFPPPFPSLFCPSLLFCCFCPCCCCCGCFLGGPFFSSAGPALLVGAPAALGFCATSFCWPRVDFFTVLHSSDADHSPGRGVSSLIDKLTLFVPLHLLDQTRLQMIQRICSRTQLQSKTNLTR